MNVSEVLRLDELPAEQIWTSVPSQINVEKLADEGIRSIK